MTANINLKASHILPALLGVTCGAPIGLAAGVFLATSVGLISQLQNTDDPIAGAVSILVVVTAPLGLVAGAVSGAYLAVTRWRIFSYTVLPTAVLLAVFIAVSARPANSHRPREFVLTVRGTPDARFSGLVLVDGEITKHEGTLPATVTVEGIRLEFAFALLEADKKICVDITANGQDLATGYAAQTGVHHNSMERAGHGV